MKVVGMSFLKSWKTSLAGLAAHALAAYTLAHEPSWNVAVHDPNFQTLLLLGCLGYVAKDWNTSSGPIGQSCQRGQEGHIASKDNKSGPVIDSALNR